MKTFISIAAYRDPQLIPTIKDCLAKARHPEELRFGICWQHGSEQTDLPFQGDPRFRILDVDWRQSRGACWARAEIMRLWDGESNFLQLDSHHRFVQDWDVKLFQQAERSGSPKPILTAYATPFSPGDPDVLGSEPLQMQFDRFTDEAIVLFVPAPIPGWEQLDRPVRARFLSAHFLFAPGSFVEDVPYDPELYFIGEEITLAVRAYTHGYDLFHPSELILWHEYTRQGRTRHWDDHVKDQGIELEWHERDVLSKEKVRRFLAGPHVGAFGCGEARTFAEYEAYAGLSFRHRRVQEYTRKGEEPPNPPAPADWAARLHDAHVDLSLDPSAFHPAALARPTFWYVGFSDDTGQEIYREDAAEDELQAILEGIRAEPTARVRISRDFATDREPLTWTVWPHAEPEGWLTKLEGPVERTAAPATLVTALLNIGRGELGGPFARPFEADDLAQFSRLLPVSLPMVIYIDPAYADRVWQVRSPHNTQIIPLRPEDLRDFPYFELVQQIRSRPEWTDQVPWLRVSPQAALEYYNPLVMSKLRWLADQARANPFKTDRLYWIDAGLSRTVGEERLHEPHLGHRLAEAGDFVFVGFPYPDGPEIHGFPRAELARAAGVEHVDRVIRGGFFGGTAQAVLRIVELYDLVLGSTLANGLMGTEESIFTILSYRYPELLRCYLVEQDGLMGPFFDAVEAGRLGDRLLRDDRAVALGAGSRQADDAIGPAGASPTRGSEPGDETGTPPGLVAEDPNGVRTGVTTFFGLRMAQNANATVAWNALTQYFDAEGVQVARIIELGTGLGGLSVLLQIYCLGRGARFITYDATGDAAGEEIFRRLAIDLRVRDVFHDFSIAEIAHEIRQDGVTVVVCDGRNKALEVSTFADFLKPGDMIFVHDYAPDRAVFESILAGRVWSWCEITDDQIRPAIQRNRLEPLRPDLLLPAAWGGWVKRAWASRQVRPLARPLDQIGLYVLGYNSPAQFQAWIDSARSAAPELLDGTHKVLLNNSTDPSTFDSYDALSAAHGFDQYRHGNLGTTGGRDWCARHFAAETAWDAMLYFEDDMLFHTAAGVCANGFQTLVPNVLALAKEIVRFEDLDFLKLSFSEVCGDHTQNWAYYNLGDEERRRDFPDGPAARFEAIKSTQNVAYALGDVFYSNWPMLITRRGNKAIFLDDPDVPRYEQLLMAHAHRLQRAGALRSGVLLASPIRHHRIHHYPREERREC